MDTKHGIVAAGDRQTARAGAWVLRQGGNAIDAICGAAFASFVCEPPLTSPAGAGVLMHGNPERGWTVLDCFARVPGLGGRADDLDFFDIQVDFGRAVQAFHVGRGSVAVPGALQGLLTVHEQHGRLPLEDVVAPAIALAREGYVVSPCIAYTLELLEPIVTMTPHTSALMSCEGRIAKAGDRLRNEGLAHLFERLVADRDGTMAAFTAHLVAEFGPERGGALTAADLDAWEPVERTPLRVAFADTTVMLNPPPSAGGGLIALGLKLAERSGLLERPYREHHNLLAEVLKATSAVRAAEYDSRLTEPGYLDALLSKSRIDALWQAQRTAATERALGSTTHISVLDANAGAASLTMSNGEGCGHTLPEWGVHANNFLGEEDINPLGFHVAPAGSPMTTMMCPTIVLRDDRPELVLGSGGSNRIRTAVVQGLVNHLGFGKSLDEAIAADRLHVEGDKLWFEATRMPAEASAALTDAWPTASRFDQQNMFFGGIHAVAAYDGVLTGAGDPRRGGAVCAANEVDD